MTVSKWRCGVCLVAFLIFFAVFIAPRLPEARAEAERVRAQEIAAEHDLYCQGWGMGMATKLHDQCIRDLQEFRAKVERRFLADNEF